jgi:hypothetical protein
VAPRSPAGAVDRLAKRENADIFVFNSQISPDRVDTLRTIICNKSPRKENSILFLTTYGGDADSAYRLAACLRRHYKRLSVYIFGLCKSAGTLATLGADTVVVKTSAEIARELAVGLFAPMTAQIEPERLGEVQRAINVANFYGNRLNRNNLKRGALERLVQGYPTHGFVIDIDEARLLFNNVRMADALEKEVGSSLPGIRRQLREPFIVDLVDSLSPKGATNGARAKTSKGPRRPVPKASSGGAGNISPLRRSATRDVAVAKGDRNSRNAGKEGSVKPSIRPPSDQSAKG